MENQEDREKTLKQREEQFRHARACKYVLQGIKYIMGYLPDFPFDIRPNFSANPVEVTLRIYWGVDVESWENMPTVIREKIEGLESQLSRITQAIPDSERSQPIHEDSTDKPILPLDKRSRNKEPSEGR